jgi:hypothetical protein
MADEFSAWEQHTLEHFLVIGREIADAAVTLRAQYLSAHVRIAEDQLVAFWYENGAVWACGRGFEVELSRMRGW